MHSCWLKVCCTKPCNCPYLLLCMYCFTCISYCLFSCNHMFLAPIVLLCIFMGSLHWHFAYQFLIWRGSYVIKQRSKMKRDLMGVISTGISALSRRFMMLQNHFQMTWKSGTSASSFIKWSTLLGFLPFANRSQSESTEHMQLSSWPPSFLEICNYKDFHVIILSTYSWKLFIMLMHTQ